MKLLSLDLSTSNSGWAVFSGCDYGNPMKLIDYGSILEPTFKGKSQLRYPQRSAIVASLMAKSVLKLIGEVSPDKIVIEEVSPNGIAGVKSIKGLCQLHGIILHLLYQSGDRVFSEITMLSPREWRGAVGLKKNGDWKASSVNLANKLFGLNLTCNDTSDAILLGQGFLKLGGYLERKI